MPDTASALHPVIARIIEALARDQVWREDRRAEKIGSPPHKARKPLRETL